MKVAIVGTTFQSVMQFRKELIELLISEGHEVFVFANDFTEATKEVVLKMKAKPVSYSLDRTGLNPIKDLRSLLELRKHFKKIKPDSVFSFFAKPSVYGTLAAKLCGVPKIVGMLEGLGYTFVKTDKFCLKRFFAKEVQVLLYRFSFRYLDNLILLNNDDLKDLVVSRKLKVKSTYVLGGIGVDLNKYTFKEVPTNPLTFIFVGRLLKAKGIVEFCEAAKVISLQFPNATFYVVGAPDFKNPDCIGELELKSYQGISNLKFVGHVSDVRPYLEKSSFLVLPSFYREGFPRCTQEAMAMGRPVITTNNVGCRESVVDGINGFIIEPKQAETLSQKIETILKASVDVKKMGIEARKFAEMNYDITKKNKILLDYLVL